MLSNAESGESGPADVYSLAKTLWVFATGQELPLQGEIRIANPRDRLEQYVASERTRTLDLLIERATRRDAGARPTMAQFAEELSAWLAPAQSIAASPDLTYLATKAFSMMAPTLFKTEEVEGMKVRYETMVQTRLFPVLDAAKEVLVKAGMQEIREGGGEDFLQHLALPGRVDIIARNERSLVTPLRGHGRNLWVGIGTVLLSNGNVVYRASHHITSSSTRQLVTLLWQMESEAQLGSEVERVSTSSMGAAFIERLPSTVDAFLTS